MMPASSMSFGLLQGLIHAKHANNRLIPLSDGHVKPVDAGREQCGRLYHDLKSINLTRVLQAEGIPSS
ncbi:MAG: hypothetical protein LUO94_01360 [Methylococcaceae bacterium]|jgi:hypothetical protein|nr:hypothetical protein [Methylococcaceae bacterium]